MPLAIELDDGSLIFDAEWDRMDDVMRASHGFGVRRMPGKLVEVNAQFQKMQDQINSTLESLTQFGIAMDCPPTGDRCEYSDLFPRECAHCLGHEPDWETKPKVKVYE